MKMFVAPLLCIALLSCASAPEKKPPVQAPANTMQELKAAQAARSSEPKKALNKLKKIVTAQPESDVADDANMLMGDILYEQGQYTEAYNAYMNIASSNVYSPLEASALNGAAKSLLKLKRFDEAEDTLEKALDNEAATPETRVQVQETLYNLYAEQNKNLEAVEMLVSLADKHPDQAAREKYRNMAQDFAESRLSSEEIQKVADSRRFSFLQAPAKFRYGTLLLEQRQYGRARDYFSEVAELAPDTEFGERSTKMIAQIDSRQKVDPRTIGVVLPLSGKHKAIGYKTLHGIQLGLGIYGGRKPSGFRLAVIDSEGNPDIARRAVDRLVVEDNVIAIIGSVLSKTAVAVASAAHEYGVPSIALSQKGDITQIGDTVFRNAVTSQMLVQHIVDVAMGQMGMSRFAIMFPNDPYGVEYANLFWDEVRARGGQVNGAQTYQPDETDFRGPVQRLVGTFYQEDRAAELQLRLKAWNEKNPKRSGRNSTPEDLLPPIIDFDAIFIPDSAKAIGQIAPMLAYNDVDKVRLLGTNIWNSPAFVQRGQKFVEGALFADSFLSDDKVFRNTDFFNNFKAAFGEEPGTFEVQAFDAAMILRQAIASGETTRIGLTQKLASLKNFPGVIGNLSATPEREFKRPLTTLTVNKGEIQKLESTRD